ncbi:MAG: non-heme iron oxygenase ferredoxin subunit [Elusimicrobia bacterium]|nr:non-heme iron oxygenase ferredoxin subunit [Elusimicrobiota bacterium]
MSTETNLQKFRLSKLSEMKEGAPQIATIANDQRIAFVLWQGQIYAFEDRCSHDDGELAGGAILNCQIECPRHGARFDLKSGKATRMPAIAPIRTYPVEVSGDDVWVCLDGEAP